MTFLATLSRRSLLAAGSTLLSACSPLGLLTAFTPDDAGGRLAVSGIAYGPDERHRLDVYVPEQGAKKAQVMVFLYGGGWNSGDRSDYAFVGRAFAAQGFVTVVPDYRLVPQVRFPAFVEDGALVLRWVRDEELPAAVRREMVRRGARLAEPLYLLRPVELSQGRVLNREAFADHVTGQVVTIGGTALGLVAALAALVTAWRLRGVKRQRAQLPAYPVPAMG